MLHSTYYHKKTNEDPRTSAVFENLMLLPDNIFWELLRRSCFDSSGMPAVVGALKDVEFWCHWDNTNTSNKLYVEPDVFLRFDLCDVIIEAKYSENSGQYLQQWKNEIAAYYNEYKDDKKHLVFIAVGGNADLGSEVVKVKGESISICKCTWLSILIAASKYSHELETLSMSDYSTNAVLRILQNVILAFNINGVYNLSWFESLAEIGFEGQVQKKTLCQHLNIN